MKPERKDSFGHLWGLPARRATRLFHGRSFWQAVPYRANHSRRRGRERRVFGALLWQGDAVSSILKGLPGS